MPIRLFISLEPPVDVADQLKRLQYEDKHARWMAPDQFHITLAFLGEQPQDSLEHVCQAMSHIHFQPFEVSTENIGFFPQGAIWLGLNTSEPLTALHRHIRAQLRVAGIHLERRRFTPHITLGRCRQQPAKLARCVQSRLETTDISTSFEVDRFYLKRSVLRPEGAAHFTEAEFLAD